MRRSLRKPRNMSIRAYVNRFLELNDQLENFPGINDNDNGTKLPNDGDDGWEDWDGISYTFPNWREEVANTNPWNPDTDGDSMTDGYEADNG